MDLDDDDFIFCSIDFQELMLSNELQFPEPEIPGDFDTLSNLLASSQTKELSEEDCVPALSFEDLIPAEKPGKSKSHLLTDGNHFPSSKSKDRARNMLEGLPGHTSEKLNTQSNANVTPGTNNLLAQSSQLCAGQQPRETSSRLRMESAPSLPVQRQERHWEKGSLQAFQLHSGGLLPTSADRQQEKLPQSVGHSEMVPARENLPETRRMEQKNSFDEKLTEQLMYIHLSEIPSLPKKESRHKQDVRMDIDMDQVMAQIDLTRIRSGNSGDAVQPETPKYTKLIEDASQPRLRYSEGASASHYCHICGRASNTAQLAACANVRIGLCRKTLCEKCLILHQSNFFQWAKANDTTWTCTHCRGVCPKRARCHQYQRNNMRRRLKNAKGTPDETKEALKLDKKIAKTPTGRKARTPKSQSNTPRAPEAPRAVFNKLPLQFSTTVPMSFPGEDIALHGSDEANPSSGLSRKESAHSQNGIFPCLNNAPSGPTAHINVDSGAFVRFDVSSTRNAGDKGRSEVPRATAIARPVLKQTADVKSGGDGVSPTGIAQGLFSDGCVQGEGYPEAR